MPSMQRKEEENSQLKVIYTNAHECTVLPSLLQLGHN